MRTKLGLTRFVSLTGQAHFVTVVMLIRCFDIRHYGDLSVALRALVVRPREPFLSDFWADNDT